MKKGKRVEDKDTSEPRRETITDSVAYDKNVQVKQGKRVKSRVNNDLSRRETNQDYAANGNSELMAIVSL